MDALQLQNETEYPVEDIRQSHLVVYYWEVTLMSGKFLEVKPFNMSNDITSIY